MAGASCPAICPSLESLIADCFETAQSTMKTSPPRLVIVAQILGMFLALGWQSNVSATVVVGLIDHQHHRIVLAGDGKMTEWSRHGKEIHVSQHPTCKVFATRTCAFTINGIVGDRDTHFDVSKLAFKACNFQGTLLVKADYFSNRSSSDGSSNERAR
jgi:hypothetical protein